MQPPPLSYPILEQQNCQILHFKTDGSGSGWSKAERKGGQTDIVFLPERPLSFTQTSRHGSHEREGWRERQPLQV